MSVSYNHDKKYIPTHLLIQWHITERCNLRCTHCYQEQYNRREELDFSQLLFILTQLKQTLTYWSEQCGHPVTGHITVTGGEPFIRRDFLALLELFAAHSELFSFAILTNGSFIDKTMAKQLASLKPRFVQVSLEGSELTHDNIRGQGSWQRTISAIRHLRRERINTLISFTAHKNNVHEFPTVVDLGRKLKVNRIWADRLIPWGQAEKMSGLLPEETQAFFQLMHQSQLDSTKRWFNKTEVAMNRALQFLVAGGEPYHCKAGDTLVTVQANGDLYPCRRMPIRVGNLLTTPFIELYEKSQLFNQLRDKTIISQGCEHCRYVQNCRGGLKCLAYATTGDPFKADPGCWLQNN